MNYDWIRESPPKWDSHKMAIIGNAPPGIFDFREFRNGELLPGDWWRIERDGAVLGYGWFDDAAGDAEFLLAVDPHYQESGIGTFILGKLEEEAMLRGLNYIYNIIRVTHPDGKRLAAWLKKRGFRQMGGGRFERRISSAPSK